MNFNDIPGTIERLMAQTMNKISEAAARQDLSVLEMQTKRASALKQMKEQIAAIQNNLIRFMDGNNGAELPSKHLPLGQREVTIHVSQGMINQNLLTLTDPIRRGQLRAEEEMTIEAQPSGEKFTSVIMTQGNKLRERGAIGRFYREAKVHDGDSVTLREIRPGHWTLAKANTNSY